jgi:ABC-type antimicrobial peptide transport system permease subunit
MHALRQKLRLLLKSPGFTITAILILGFGSGARVGLTGVGLVIGVVATLLLSHLVSRMLYEVSANDPCSFLIAILALGVAAFLACLLPALRASRTNPITAPRE